MFCPDTAVRRLRIGDRVLSDTQASIVSFLWFVFLPLGLTVLLATLPTAVPLENAIFGVMSAQGNVGLSAGITGPEMPLLAKVAFLFTTWIGRFAIVPVLVLARSLLTRFGLYE